MMYIRLMEEWRKIPGFDERYEVSSFGHIRRAKSIYWRFLHGKYTPHILPEKTLSLGTISQKGYIEVRFANRLHRLHRLIALAFVPNPNDLPQINHKNANKLDNRPENLEWCTNQQNRDHMVRLGLHAFGSRSGTAILKEKDIPVIRNLIKQKFSQANIANRYNVSSSCIQGIADGHNWRHIK